MTVFSKQLSFEKIETLGTIYKNFCTFQEMDRGKGKKRHPRKFSIEIPARNHLPTKPTLTKIKLQPVCCYTTQKLLGWFFLCMETHYEKVLLSSPASPPPGVPSCSSRPQRPPLPAGSQEDLPLHPGAEWEDLCPSRPPANGPCGTWNEGCILPGCSVWGQSCQPMGSAVRLPGNGATLEASAQGFPRIPYLSSHRTSSPPISDGYCLWISEFAFIYRIAFNRCLIMTDILSALEQWIHVILVTPL